MRTAVAIMQLLWAAMLVAIIVLIVPNIIDCHMGGCETDAECERLCGARQ